MTTFSARSAACVLLWLSVAGVAALAAAAPVAGPQKHNHELLTNLGLVRRRVPPAHHRKRLAAEMRSSGSHDDSHMVVIRLPPAPYYYAHNKPAKAAPEASPNAVSKVPVHFHGNGKPTGVYHWNLPVIKKIKTGHGRHGGASKRTSDGDSKIYHIQKTSPFSEHSHHFQNTPHTQQLQHMMQRTQHGGTQHSHSNEVLKAKDSAGTAAVAVADAGAGSAQKSQLLKSKISYYTPRRKTMFHKFFQGNGKPHSFYVIEKSKKPIHYHRLLPGTR